MISNKVRDQSLTSSTCGYHCVAFLRDRLNMISWKVASGFNGRGEARIRSIIDMLPKIPAHFGKDGKGFKKILKGVWNGVKKVGTAIFNTKARNGFSPSIRKLLEKYGNEKISSINVYRIPINSIINKILNWVTLGTFQANLQSLNYDNAFHLFMYVHLQTGVTIRFDKNEIIEAKLQSVPNARHDTAEDRQISNVNISLNDFLNNGIKQAGEQHYFHYDSRNDNCQKWILDNLKGNRLLTSDLQSFIHQDPEAIYKGLGILGTVNKVITDTASKADTYLYGEGKRKKKLKR
jgi:hypothetical protein